MSLVLDKDRVEFLPNSFEPAILFTVKFRASKGLIAILDVKGLLVAEDEKIIAFLRKIDTEFKPMRKVVTQLGGRGTNYDRELTKEEEREVKLVAFLSREVEKYLEDLRHKNPRRNVVLKLRLKDGFSMLGDVYFTYFAS